jgi:hypothetical protein
MLPVLLSLTFGAHEVKNRKPDRIVFQRYFDQTEGAFLVLVPNESLSLCLTFPQD